SIIPPNGVTTTLILYIATLSLHAEQMLRCACLASCRTTIDYECLAHTTYLPFPTGLLERRIITTHRTEQVET
ncbi:hypothetical protein BJ878DRAFT_525279, partial [Calycina marina]